MNIKEQFLERVRYYKGVPFVHQGRNREVGLDCAGLIVVALEDIKYPVKDLEGYTRLPKASRLLGILDNNHARKVPISAMEPGDVLLMRFSREPQHLAVYTGNTIIHSYQRKGCVVENRMADVWKKRIVGVYSLV